VLVAVDGDELDRAAERLDEKLLAVVGEADGADLELPEDARDAHCLVLVHDGQRRGAVEEARRGTELVEDREQWEASERGTKGEARAMSRGGVSQTTDLYHGEAAGSSSFRFEPVKPEIGTHDSSSGFQPEVLRKGSKFFLMWL
jgi:hypothetical protein